MSNVKKWMHQAICPECVSKDTIRSIEYGYPSLEMSEDENIILGGCLIPPGPVPKHACTKCDWEGTFKNGKVFTPPTITQELQDLLNSIPFRINNEDEWEQLRYTLLRFLFENYPDVKFDNSSLLK
jgi:hypothetical protein